MVGQRLSLGRVKGEAQHVSRARRNGESGGCVWRQVPYPGGKGTGRVQRTAGQGAESAHPLAGFIFASAQQPVAIVACHGKLAVELRRVRARSHVDHAGVISVEGQATLIHQCECL